MTTTTFTPRPASRRARLTATATRLTLRPVASALPANAVGIAVSRQILARSLAAFGSPARGVRVEQVDQRTPAGRIRGEWVSAGAQASRGEGGATGVTGALFYIHGSGYALCSAKSHRKLVSQLSARTGLPVFSLDYRLAPRHRFPSAADDVERAFAWLVDNHVPADRIVVAGDSAGGHLAFDLSLTRLRAGLSLPAAQLLLSPLADVTLELARRREQAIPDPMATAATARGLLAHYIREVDPLHDRLTHVLGPDEVLPPTLIQAGGAEMLAADAHHLYDALRSSGTWCRLEVWPGQMHVFQAMPRLVPESSVALDRAARFLTEALAGELDGSLATRLRVVGPTKRRSA